METTDKLIDSTPALNTTASADSDLVTKMVAASELAKNPEVVREMTKYGKTPVVYMPTKSMWKAMYRQQDPGLSHLISNAMTVQEVNNLLKKGKEGYKDAQPKTIRKWEKVAAQRIKELETKP